MREFTVVTEKDEDDWLISSVLELPGCHSRKTLDELMESYRGISGSFWRNPARRKRVCRNSKDQNIKFPSVV